MNGKINKKAKEILALARKLLQHKKNKAFVWKRKGITHFR